MLSMGKPNTSANGWFGIGHTFRGRTGEGSGR
jgi:hypothetical protein